jgi:hypothetical protein
MMRRAAIATAAALLLVPAAAPASNVHVGASPNQRFAGGTHYGEWSVYYDAVSGEVNNVDVYYEPHGAFVQVNDLDAPIHAGSSCHLIDPHAARCTVPPGSDADRIRHTELRLGDGEDRLEVHPANPIGTVTAFAGPARDVVEGGSSADDELFGGPGNDLLNGFGGRDRILGGGGDDRLTDGDTTGGISEPAPDADVLGGGAGEDVVDYGERRENVSVDLHRHRGGQHGERDVVKGVEDATTGSGNDRLAGTAGRNLLRAQGGRDVLIGRGGDGDQLKGGSGRDRVVGGSGADLLHPGIDLDSVVCGRGRDVVFNPVPGELMAAACELGEWNHAFGEPGAGHVSFGLHPVSTSRRSVVFKLACPTYPDGVRPCAGRITIRQGRTRRGRVLGRARFFHDASSRRVRVKLNRRGRALVGRPGGVVTTIAIKGIAKTTDGRPRQIAWTTPLSAR